MCGVHTLLDMLGAALRELSMAEVLRVRSWQANRNMLTIAVHGLKPAGPDQQRVLLSPE